MSAVLRVKRRHDQEPHPALLIAGKKRKIEVPGAEEVNAHIPLTAVVKFAGTLKNQEDNVVEHLNKTLSKDELRANYKQHAVDIASKARMKMKENSKENRFKVLNYFRAVHDSSSEKLDDSAMTVIDVEHTISSAEPKVLDPETEIGYVYDVYYTQNCPGLEMLNMNMDHDFDIHPFEQELVFDSLQENAARPDEDYSSEDSNAESNVKNDYPDSDHSERSIDNDDMRDAVRRLKIDGESSDLSSEDDFVYALDEDDVEAHGSKYAKYKARVKEELDDGDGDHSDSSVSDQPTDDDENKTDDD